MTISMYEASVPRYLNMLGSLDLILRKGQGYAEARKIAPEVLPGARLFPDMLPLIKQVQIACDHAKGSCARLAGVEVPRFEDNEKTFDELIARVAKTVDFIKTLKPAQIDGSEEREIAITAGGHEYTFKGMQYLLGYALPNFYFHLVTAYNILRHNGVEIGKKDYIGKP